MSKEALLRAIAGTNRGLLADSQTQREIEQTAAQMESQSPTLEPLSAPELSGVWRLLYTTSAELLQIDRFPLFKLGQIYQCLYPDTATVYNIAEVPGLPYLDGIISVAATFTPVSNVRVNVAFNRAVFGLQRLINYQSPAELVAQMRAGSLTAIDFPIQRENQQGWLEVTYLDPDLRIGRGNAGSLFILGKA
ncbi:MAG: PAP/fibrillin family protein [Cyanobacteria bacterium P01_A01_bin.135]